ncbi:MAG: 4'-phosphopantetheinyl transferase family protein [Solirubrobacteraceae bacterium]
MTAPAWLTRSSADVPRDDDWLGPRERAVLAGLRIAKRREDWRLGRWTAKTAVAAQLGTEPARIEILAAADGAPEAWLDGAPAPVSVSLSHRGGRAVAAVATAPAVVGCDLELVEPRSPAFLREWLTPHEQALVAQQAGAERDRLANLLWSAREAAAKVRREGLRLDVRRAEVTLGAGDGEWRPFCVHWGDGSPATAGWVLADEGWVTTVAGDPAPRRPSRLSAPP